MDNVYDNRRVNDRNYSDLFNQCINTGGSKPSPYKKKGQGIQSVSKQWNNVDLEKKMQRDYSGYNARD